MEIQNEAPSAASIFTNGKKSEATKQAEQSAKKEQGTPKESRKRLDRLELSKQALAQVQALLTPKTQAEKTDKSQLDMLLESSQKEVESSNDQLVKMQRCQKIARRIMKGDIVPFKDRRYLMEHEPELYKMAIMLRKQNDKPEKHKSLLKDDGKTSSERMGLEKSNSTDFSAASVQEESGEGTDTGKEGE